MCKVDKSLANCVGAECDADYKAAFVLYKEAFDIDCANYKVFDVEQRIPLRDYRIGLKVLIAAREAKLKALEKQAEELRASLADPGTTLAELFPLIDQHIKIQDVACKKMPLNTEKILKELKAMQSDVSSGKFSCEIEGGETPNIRNWCRKCIVQQLKWRKRIKQLKWRKRIKQLKWLKRIKQLKWLK